MINRARPGPIGTNLMRSITVQKNNDSTKQKTVNQPRLKSRIDPQVISSCMAAVKQKAKSRVNQGNAQDMRKVSIGSFLDIVDHSENSEYDGIVQKYRAGVK